MTDQMVTSETERALVEVPRDECFRLLATQPLGRLAVAVEGEAPLVAPVNYLLDGEAIMFRTDAGSKLDHLRQAPVSFEVDFVDWSTRTGWSVLVQGVAYEATHYETDHLKLQPWAPGPKRTWVRIVVRDVTGRRLRPTDLDFARDPRGYL